MRRLADTLIASPPGYHLPGSRSVRRCFVEIFLQPQGLEVIADLAKPAGGGGPSDAKLLSDFFDRERSSQLHELLRIVGQTLDGRRQIETHLR